MDNNNETNSRRLGGIFLIISWLLAIGLGTLLINSTIFATKPANIIKSEHGTTITIQRDYDSHFRIKGSINGIPVTFLVDTGATSIAVPDSVARRAELTRGEEIASSTANGIAISYFTRIQSLKLGDVEFSNVNAVITPGIASGEVLLGMNLLKKLTIKQDQSTMILTVP